jgi:transcriptional regulator with XRE-family HTH domain
MVSSRQIRAARSLLGWTQQTLADKSVVAVNSVRAVERDLPYPKSETVEAIKGALRRAGIVFLPEDNMGEGVRLNWPRLGRR